MLHEVDKHSSQNLMSTFILLALKYAQASLLGPKSAPALSTFAPKQKVNHLLLRHLLQLHTELLCCAAFGR